MQELLEDDTDICAINGQSALAVPSNVVVAARPMRKENHTTSKLLSRSLDFDIHRFDSKSITTAKLK